MTDRPPGMKGSSGRDLSLQEQEQDLLTPQLLLHKDSTIYCCLCLAAIHHIVGAGPSAAELIHDHDRQCDWSVVLIRELTRYYPKVQTKCPITNRTARKILPSSKSHKDSVIFMPPLILCGICSLLRITHLNLPNIPYNKATTTGHHIITSSKLSIERLTSNSYSYIANNRNRVEALRISMLGWSWSHIMEEMMQVICQLARQMEGRNCV
mmetsp:Transcript_34111/g.62810  ORF Transcript_34111/g.62810 Transcript_34111/m.62810 type:complete len:210 (+) Transcript_34111:167-796(+)